MCAIKWIQNFVNTNRMEWKNLYRTLNTIAVRTSQRVLQCFKRFVCNATTQLCKRSKKVICIFPCSRYSSVQRAPSTSNLEILIANYFNTWISVFFVFNSNFFLSYNLYAMPVSGVLRTTISISILNLNNSQIPSWIHLANQFIAFLLAFGT